MNPTAIAPAVLVGLVLATTYAVRLRHIKKPSGRALAADEQRVGEILCESSVRLRGFLVLENASHAKLVLTNRRLLLCSRNERQVRLALRPEDIQRIEALPSGLLGKIPGLLIDYLEDGKERRLRCQTPDDVEVLWPMGSVRNTTTRDAFLARLTEWCPPRRAEAAVPLVG
ncbi:MAG: hypothetical protein U1F60_09205 [Planctomycetota bacterium]